jgi:hypothetical protein
LSASAEAVVVDVSDDGGELVEVGEFGQSVHGGVHAVGAVHADDPGDHLVFQLYVGADVVNEAWSYGLGEQRNSHYLNCLGRYSFRLPELLGGMRPLRAPDAAEGE